MTKQRNYTQYRVHCRPQNDIYAAFQSYVTVKFKTMHKLP